MSAPRSQQPTSGAVFISYASQDAEAAMRICEALRAAGVEVWFDQNELTGGDAWDQKIRGQIKSCALFVPVISASTNARREGYFRREWKLAVDRTHDMDESLPFLIPVVIDETTDAGAFVPEKFREVQWTRLPSGKTPEKFCARVQSLLGSSPWEPRPAERTGGAASPVRSKARRHVPPIAWFAAASTLAVAIGAWLWWRHPPAVAAPAVKQASSATTATAAPPPARSLPNGMSPARQLAEKARKLIDEIDSTPDDYATAEGLVKRALELDQNDGEIWAISSRLNSMYMSRAFDNTDARREPARSQAERALKLAPDSVETLLAIARANRRRDEARAEAALRKALTLAPKDGRLLLNLGSLYRVQNRLDDAMVLYEQAAASADVMPLARYDQFLVTFYQRKFADAERYVREAATALPSTNFVTGQAVVELTWRGQPEAALRVLAAAPAKVRAEPRYVIVTVMAAQMNRQPEVALAALQRFSADYINDAWYIGPKALLVGLCEAQAGRPEAARLAWESGIALLRKRMQETPDSGVEHLRLGELLAWSGQKEAALREVKIYEQLTSGRPLDWVFSPARIYAALGLADAAVPLLAAELVAPASGRWPLTPTLLQLDPLWDKLRGDARFQALTVEAKPAQKQSALAPATAQKSVAVLAFKNLSGDPTREFFSDGLSEAVTDVLGRVPGLKVVGSASAFSFKGKSVPIPEIARQLGVTHLVEGTVLQDGQTVRITAKLIQADGFQVWGSDKLDRELKNIFALHDEVAGLIAKSLSLKLGASSAASTVVVNPQAFELYGQARQAWNLRTPAGMDLAENLLNRALTLEPNLARAHAALADVWTQRLGRIRTASDAEEAPSSVERERIAAKINQALTLEPDLAEAHASLGSLLWRGGKMGEAESSLRRAILLNPNYASGQQWLGQVLLNQARMDEALEHLKLATELDPLSSAIWSDYGYALKYSGQRTEGIIAFDRALTLQPNSAGALGGKSFALVELGRLAEAVALMKSVPSDRADTMDVRVFVLARAGLKAEAESLFAARGLSARVSRDSRNLIALGRTEEAMALIVGKGLNPGGAANFFWNPIYDPLRNDPRWVKLMADAGLTEAHARAQAWRKAHPPDKPAAKQ